MRELTDDERDVVECNLRLVGDFVESVRLPFEDRDELFQAALFGLAVAVQTCIAEQGALSTHASWKMRAAIQRHRQRDRLIQIPHGWFDHPDSHPYAEDVARARGVGGLIRWDGEPVDVPVNADPFDVAANRDEIAALRAAVGGLAPRQASVMMRRMSGQTHVEIGEAIGVARRAVGEIEFRATAELREAMAGCA